MKNTAASTRKKAVVHSTTAAGSASPGAESSCGKTYACFSCGNKNHTRNNCRYREYKCNQCGSIGHLAKVCKVPKSKTTVKSYSKPNVSHKFMQGTETDDKE
jgi:Zinc knuckle